MADLPTTTILVGLAVALAEAVKWLAKAVTMDSRKRNGTEPVKSGQLTPEDWEGRIEKVVRKVLDDKFPGRRQ